MISIIIPVYNEQQALLSNANFLTSLSRCSQLIFVDGSSDDDTADVAKEFGEVISSAKGRALQMNEGALHAENDILLFLHADSHISLDALKQIERVCTYENYVGGCLKQYYDKSSILFRWIAWTGNIRAKLSKLYYGDQGIFVIKKVFNQLDGFPNMRICEDIFFTRRLRNEGKVGILNVPIFCSSRRWNRQGLIKTFLLNMRINFALTFNRDLSKLAEEYADVRDN